MDVIQNIFASLTRLLVVVGAGVSAVSICFAAFQWMTARGNRQGVSKAVMGLMGAVGGLILVGTAFIIPGVIGETVIERVGGMSLTIEVSYDCDEILREQFVFQRNASTAEKLNDLIARVQSLHEESCSGYIWNPVAKNADDVGGGVAGVCHERELVGERRYPAGLRDPRGDYVRINSGRDRDNNIIVHWSGREIEKPTDRSQCWMYVSGLSRWFVQD